MTFDKLDRFKKTNNKKKNFFVLKRSAGHSYLLMEMADQEVLKKAAVLVGDTEVIWS